MLNNNLDLERLTRHHLFAALDEEQLKRIVSSTQNINLEARSSVFEEGDEADHFYMLISGQVKLFCLSADGDEKVVEILQPGQTFAEAVMFMPRQIYPVSAETLDESVIYAFDMKQFRKMLEDSQQTCFRLLAIMGKRLHARINEINNLTLHNATYRLVVYLLNQLPEDAVELPGIHLNTTKNIIASRLSIQPETFSRILLKLSKQGLIKVNGNEITLLDVEGLRNLL